ncbi:uncharacterized protein B0H18DRAFT_1124169 [Fomitopsis serialis]|uniref:uncharacterized protein n=1 Tax=Fomitopsis serialis TaxID=139415 RepID=UPI00200725D0|nr:uncharacterized protein B0H18DRAFT_1124169 [Neoantrodia serialis]KAH9916529.1 hypothetical protein B0H18DRAFT_1124169 [Neoantrodia serialis]
MCYAVCSASIASINTLPRLPPPPMGIQSRKAKKRFRKSLKTFVNAILCRHKAKPDCRCLIVVETKDEDFVHVDPGADDPSVEHIDLVADRAAWMGDSSVPKLPDLGLGSAVACEPAVRLGSPSINVEVNQSVEPGPMGNLSLLPGSILPASLTLPLPSRFWTVSTCVLFQHPQRILLLLLAAGLLAEMHAMRSLSLAEYKVVSPRRHLGVTAEMSRRADGGEKDTTVGAPTHRKVEPQAPKQVATLVHEVLVVVPSAANSGQPAHVSEPLQLPVETNEATFTPATRALSQPLGCGDEVFNVRVVQEPEAVVAQIHVTPFETHADQERGTTTEDNRSSVGIVAASPLTTTSLSNVISADRWPIVLEGTVETDVLTQVLPSTGTGVSDAVGTTTYDIKTSANVGNGSSPCYNRRGIASRRLNGPTNEEVKVPWAVPGSFILATPKAVLDYSFAPTDTSGTPPYRTHSQFYGPQKDKEDGNVTEQSNVSHTFVQETSGNKSTTSTVSVSPSPKALTQTSCLDFLDVSALSSSAIPNSKGPTGALVDTCPSLQAIEGDKIAVIRAITEPEVVLAQTHVTPPETGADQERENVEPCEDYRSCVDIVAACSLTKILPSNAVNADSEPLLVQEVVETRASHELCRRPLKQLNSIPTPTDDLSTKPKEIEVATVVESHPIGSLDVTMVKEQQVPLDILDVFFPAMPRDVLDYSLVSTNASATLIFPTHSRAHTLQEKQTGSVPEQSNMSGDTTVVSSITVMHGPKASMCKPGPGLSSGSLATSTTSSEGSGSKDSALALSRSSLPANDKPLTITAPISLGGPAQAPAQEFARIVGHILSFVAVSEQKEPIDCLASPDIPAAFNSASVPTAVPSVVPTLPLNDHGSPMMTRTACDDLRKLIQVERQAADTRRAILDTMARLLAKHEPSDGTFSPPRVYANEQPGIIGCEGFVQRSLAAEEEWERDMGGVVSALVQLACVPRVASTPRAASTPRFVTTRQPSHEASLDTLNSCNDKEGPFKKTSRELTDAATKKALLSEGQRGLRAVAKHEPLKVESAQRETVKLRVTGLLSKEMVPKKTEDEETTNAKKLRYQEYVARKAYEKRIEQLKDQPVPLIKLEDKLPGRPVVPALIRPNLLVAPANLYANSAMTTPLKDMDDIRASTTSSPSVTPSRLPVRVTTANTAQNGGPGSVSPVRLTLDKIRATVSAIASPPSPPRTPGRKTTAIPQSQSRKTHPTTGASRFSSVASSPMSSPITAKTPNTKSIAVSKKAQTLAPCRNAELQAFGSAGDIREAYGIRVPVDLNSRYGSPYHPAY